MSRQPQFVRFFGIALMLLAWGAASNRCALAALTRASAPEKAAEIHRCCPMKAPGEGEPASDNRTGECCRGLRVLLSDVTGKQFEFLELSVGHILEWVPRPESRVEAEDVAVMQTTDPPGYRSFAEVVLQRSVLGHAPPFVV